MAWTQPDQPQRFAAAALMKAALIMVGGGDIGKELTAAEKSRIKIVAATL